MTANRATLLALASRVEAATGADRELDAAIAVAVSDDVGAWVVEPSPSSLFSHQPGWFCTSDNRSHKAPAYTASLDAAMSLYITIPERIPSNPRLATAEALRQRAIAGSMTDD